MYRSFRFSIVLILFLCCVTGGLSRGTSLSLTTVNTASPALTSPNVDISTGFETNTAEGWTPRIGTESVTVTSSDRRSGMYSLLTQNRTAAFQGCRINVTNAMTIGSRYRITVWAKLSPGAAASDLRVSLQRTVGANTTFANVVSNTPVTNSAWVRLTALYDHTLAHDALSLYVESNAGTSSFYIDDFQLAFVPPLQIQTDIPSLKTVLAPNFKIGSAISQGRIVGAHGQLLSKHFNSVTAENDMKWGPIHPTETTYNYGPADALVNYAVANGMQVRGHALVWHEQNPPWLFLDANGQTMTPTPANKALLLQRLDTHIRAVMGHFGNNVQAWDVVNEVIDPSQMDGFRRSMWFQICGTEYIDKAFQVAREMSPTAKLYINDFSTHVPAKRTFLRNLVQDLKNRGIPIDGVGHQMHVNIDAPSATEVIDTINVFSAIPGIDNQITEMDISVYNNGTQMYDVIPRGVLRKQGYRYRDLFNAYRSLQGKISSVTVWGLADDNTWLSNFPIARLEAPLLFDDILQAKYAYWGVVDPRRLLETPFDFDGDRKTDISIFRPGPGEWWYNRSSNGGNTALQFGNSTDRLVPTDYTGDGITDVAFWRPSTGFWFVLRSEDFSFYSFPFGTTGDVPVPADYDGDGKSDAAVFRESSLTWFISKSLGGTDIVGFGAAGDKPVNADYDGDGKADIAIFRPNGANGSEWWIRRSSTGVVMAAQFGVSTDKAVPGDFTGDGKIDVAFWRPSNGFWTVLRSEDFSFFAFPFGTTGDVPVPGDYDGDGRQDAGVFRPSNSTWFVQRSTAGTLIQQFGAAGDQPLPNAFVR